MDNTGEMDRFFQRMRSDLMYELRNIQHGERPVTGQNHRQHLQDFIRKNVKIDTHSDGKRLETETDTTDEHRPEAIVVEIQGIVEQRPVSSILHSAALRRRLEHALNDNLGRMNVSSNNRASIRTTTQSPRSAAAASLRRDTGSSTGLSDTSVPTPPLTRSDSVTSLTSELSFSSAVSSIEEDFPESAEDIDIVDPPSSNGSFEILEGQERQVNENEEASSPQRSQSLDQPQPMIEEPVWSDVSGIHRQELIEEISELLHDRLVSSTLDGEFRATLELHMQDRAQVNGSNGIAVQNFIRSLPRSGVRRNDFSDLGIPSGIENDNWDAVSVTNVSAHSVPYNQTNSFLSREIQQLKGQMSELKNMLKMSIDIQMEVQRSVRQEVAAALAQGACGGTESDFNPSHSTPVNDTHCLICLDKHSDTVLYQCGHMCVCFHCGRDLMTRNHTCPVCRAPIKDVIRAYKTNAE